MSLLLLLSDDGPKRLAAVMQSLRPAASMYVRKVDVSAFGVGLINSDGKLVEWQQRKNADGALLLRGAFCTGSPTYSSYIKPTLSGTFNTAQPNSFTAQVGASFSFSFSGTGFSLRHYADNRGGMWQFSVDGVPVGSVSTFKAVAGDTEQLVVAGLENTTHAVSAVFTGADPLNPPSGGSARGWLKYDYNSSGSTVTSTAKCIGPLHVSGLGASAIDITNSGSIPDFAISARKEGSGMASTWVPLHGSSPNVMRSISCTLSVDGVSVDANPANLAGNIEFFDTAVFTQTYTAFNSNDAAGDFPMWDGVITHTYSRAGLNITHSLDFKYGDVNAHGYLAMLPSEVGNCERLITNAGEKIAISAGDTQVNFSRIASSVAFINATTGNGCAIDVSLSQVLNPSLPDNFFYTIRPDSVTKAYWLTASGTIAGGTKLYCSNNYSAVTGATFPAAWTS